MAAAPKCGRSRCWLMSATGPVPAMPCTFLPCRKPSDLAVRRLELKAFFGAELFQDRTIQAAQLHKIVDAAKRLARTPGHNGADRRVVDLQRLFQVFGWRGVDVYDGEVSLEVVHHAIKLVVGAIGAIAPLLPIALLPSAASTRRK